MNPVCPICSAQSVLHRSDLYDDRYAYPGRFHVYRCQSCAHAFTNFMPSSTEVAKLYSDYYPRRNYDPSTWHPPQDPRGFVSWLWGRKGGAYAWVPERVRVLDVGTGAGESLGYHNARGCQAVGMDPDANVERIAREKNLQIKIGLFSNTDIQGESFDYVTMNQVIEHFVDPIEVMKEAARVLVPGGRLIMGTPNYRGLLARLFGARWIHWHIPYHIHFFSRQSMQKAASLAGLELESVNMVTESDWMFFQICHALTRPAPESASRFWSVGEQRPLLTKLAMGLALIPRFLRLTHLWTRMLDAMGAGDNVVYICRKPSR